MKRTIAILIAIMLCVTLCGSACADDNWTIFVYLCGSDLESENSFATDNMQEMIDASAASNVRFVVQTGGAAEWHNGASADELDRFEIAGGVSTIVDRQPRASMGDSETLAGFLRWGLAAYPSAHNGLVLWNHGITAAAASTVSALMNWPTWTVSPCGISTAHSAVFRALCRADLTSSALMPA